MITSLWPLVHCTTLEYLDMKRNQLTHILHLNDILYIRKSSEYTPPQGAKVLSTDSRPTHLPESLTYLDVSYNQNLLTLTGLVFPLPFIISSSHLGTLRKINSL